jgi:hypothetical protein
MFFIPIRGFCRVSVDERECVAHFAVASRVVPYADVSIMPPAGAGSAMQIGWADSLMNSEDAPLLEPGSGL